MIRWDRLHYLGIFGSSFLLVLAAAFALINDKGAGAAFLFAALGIGVALIGVGMAYNEEL